MSFGSKRTFSSLAAGVVLYAAYIVYALSRRAPEADNLKSWAIVMLVFIGVGIVLVIIIQILFHIVSAIGISVKNSEKDVDRIISSSMVEDERDKLISLKSAHIGYFFAGCGYVAALAALALGVKTLYALHFMLGSFGAASIIEGILSIYYYEKGIRNG